MDTIWLGGAEWLALLRIGLGLWWLESWRHKDKKGWFERGTGIAWAADVASKHRWNAVRSGFDTIVAPRPGRWRTWSCTRSWHSVSAWWPDC